MGKVTSKDGTSIAFDKSGQGEPVILVDGALCHRGFGPMRELAQHLSPHLTVYIYDRRGRGESGDTAPYAVEREVEDIEAIIQEAGRSVFAYGTSSGAALALEAALKLGDRIRKLALFEPPYNADSAARQASSEYAKQLKQALAAGRRGDAVALFMTLVGMPGDQIDGVRHAPIWPVFEAVAPTLAYDNAVLGVDAAVPTKRASSIAVPTLVMNGSASYPFMRETADALGKAIPNAQRRVLEGQTHEVAAEAIAPVLVEFFAD